jgi:dihydropteroate synthase
MNRPGNPNPGASLAERLQTGEPLVMGIVNVTPDSFSDGGRFDSTANAVAHAQRLIEEGADLLDLGGESTRPGATPVAVDDELRRVMPVLERIVPLGVPVSVDTRKTAVMREALAAGAQMINDVAALRDEGAVELLAGSSAFACLMQMQGEPASMQLAPHYDDVVAEVEAFLRDRLAVCAAARIECSRLLVDPGIGFGKSTAHNLALMRSLPRMAALGCPLLVGISRKGIIGKLTGRQQTDDRTAGSVAAALWSIAQGARIVRVHDVAATVDAVRVWRGFQEGKT